MATSKTARKVKFAAGGAAGGAVAGSAVCDIAIDVVGLGIDEPLCLAIVTVVSAAAAWLTGYIARPHSRDSLA